MYIHNSWRVVLRFYYSFDGSSWRDFGIPLHVGDGTMRSCMELEIDGHNVKQNSLTFSKLFNFLWENSRFAKPELMKEFSTSCL
jgi:hypothetical protein